MLREAISRFSASVFNRKIAAWPEMRESLARSGGKVLAVSFWDAGRIAFRIRECGLLDPVHPAVHSSCRIAFRSVDEHGVPKWSVEGDAELLKAVSELVEAGGADISGHVVASAIRPVFREARDLSSRLGQALQQYVESEQNWAVGRSEFAAHRKTLSKLTRRIEKLSDTVRQISGNINKDGKAI